MNAVIVAFQEKVFVKGDAAVGSRPEVRQPSLSRAGEDEKRGRPIHARTPRGPPAKDHSSRGV